MIVALLLALQDSPADAVKAATAATKKLKGYDAALDVQSEGATQAFKGSVRVKDATAQLKGDNAEVWCRDHVYVGRTAGGGYKKVNDLDAGERTGAAPAVNPQMIVSEFLRSEIGAEFAGEESVGDAACKIVTATAPQDLRQSQIEVIFDKFAGPTMGNLAKRLDAAASTSTYRAWIDAKGGIRRIEWTIDPKVGGYGVSGLGALGDAASKRLGAVYLLTISDGDGKLDVPDDVEPLLK